MTELEIRNTFEAWAKSRNYSLDKCDHEMYTDKATAFVWAGFKAGVAKGLQWAWNND